MEQYVKSLYDRLDGNAEKQAILIEIMDGAINEMHNCGVLASMPQELQEKIYSEDPQERIDTKVSIAKSVAYDNFIEASNPVMLKTGGVGHAIRVKYRTSFINSICLCIQGGLEGLYQSGIYKHCENEVMQYYVQSDVAGEDRQKFRMKLLQLEGLYENFQINLLPMQTADDASQATDVEDKRKIEEKQSFFGRIKEFSCTYQNKIIFSNLLLLPLGFLIAYIGAKLSNGYLTITGLTVLILWLLIGLTVSIIGKSA